MNDRTTRIARRSRLGVVALLLFAGPFVVADEPTPATPNPPATPTPPATETPGGPGERYGGTPEDLLPYRGAGEPARRFFTEAPEFRGPGADEPDPVVDAVRLGVISPFGGADAKIGEHVRNGYRLALEEANAAGGYRPGVPFATVDADENDQWGAAANALVRLTSENGIWAVLGALEDANSHVMTRVILKLELPMVNTGGPDPTLTEHMIPWLVRVRPDDRQTGYRLADAIFRRDGHQRVAVIRSNDRYGRMGIAKLTDAARRLHHPMLLEVRFDEQATDVSHAIERLRAAKPDAVVLWGRAVPAGRALRAMRAAGIDVPVYGPDRLVDPELLAIAGLAAEGLVVSHPFDPERTDPAWTGFRARYAARFGHEPDAPAAYAYDGMSYLIDAVRTAGLNRVRIVRALYARKEWAGVTGKIAFDITHNNVAPTVLGVVKDGAFHFGH